MKSNLIKHIPATKTQIKKFSTLLGEGRQDERFKFLKEQFVTGNIFFNIFDGIELCPTLYVNNNKNKNKKKLDLIKEHRNRVTLALRAERYLRHYYDFLGYHLEKNIINKNYTIKIIDKAVTPDENTRHIIFEKTTILTDEKKFRMLLSKLGIKDDYKKIKHISQIPFNEMY